MRQPASPSLWNHGDFLRLWAGQTVSQFGTQITVLALPLLAAVMLEASPFEMGLLGAAEMAPFLLIGLPAGVWVDRLPRRPLLIGGDVGRALVLASIPIAHLVGLLTIWQLYVVAFVVGTLTVFFDVAYMAYLPALVNREQLIEGNSKMETSRAAAEVAGPGIAGVLIQALTAPVAIAFDAASFLCSALVLGLIRRREPPATLAPGGVRPALLAEMREGLRFVLTHPLLRPIAFATGTINLFRSAIGALYVLFAVRDLGLDAATLGFVLAAGNAGFLFGAVLAGRAASSLGLGATIVGAAMLTGLGGLLLPFATPAFAVPVLIASGLLVGLGNPLYNVNQVSLRQAITPDRLQGRMNATMRFVVWGTMPIGYLTGGVAGEWLGLRTAIALLAVGAALAFLWLLFSPVRSLREHPAPAQ